MSRQRFAHDARRLFALGWPMFVGQMAMLAYATVDTILVGRYAAERGTPLDLAALAVGSASYTSVFVGLMGVVTAVAPITGRLYGARQLPQAGAQLHQAVWLVLALALPGMLLLVFPTPLLALAQADAELGRAVRGYLLALACSLPASLLMSAFRGFNTAVSRPKAVMMLQLSGLALKVPLSALLVWGAGPVPGLGVLGCGIATAIVTWSVVAAAVLLLRRDAYYRPFELFPHGRWALRRPDAASLRALLKLGVPSGLSTLVEVTGFTFMALFIARLGTVPVAGHQIASNIAALLFMLPLAISTAAGALVAQRIGAGDREDAVTLGRHAMQLAGWLALGSALLLALGRGPMAAAYTTDPAVRAAAMVLLAWVGAFHVADALQTVAAFVLRAWHVTVWPLVIYAGAIWGLGLGGGYLLAFDPWGLSPAAVRGAPGYWCAAWASLTVAALALGAMLRRVHRQQRHGAAITPPAA